MSYKANSDSVTFTGVTNPRLLKEEPVLDMREPQIIFLQGMRKAGKSVALEKILLEHYLAGILVMHLFAAGSFENLYWCINKNCKQTWIYISKILNAFNENGNESIRLKNLIVLTGIDINSLNSILKVMVSEKLLVVDDDTYDVTQKGVETGLNQPLHCNCDQAYPIIWLVPDYVDVDKYSVDKFNGVYFTSKNEYCIAALNGMVPLELQRKSPDQPIDYTRVKKPQEMLTRPLIIVKKITVPTTPTRVEIFKEQFEKIVLQARDEHRIICMNPQIFQKAVERYKTVEEIMRFIPELTQNHFQPLNMDDVGKTKDKWTKYEKSYHKISIGINEIRDLAPSNALSANADSKSSKKGLFSLIPVIRHFNCYFTADFQNYEDLFQGIKKQANIMIIKRATKFLLGDDFGFIIKSVDNERQNFIEKYGMSKRLWKYIERKMPRVQNLPDNKAYAIFPDGTHRLIKFDAPRFHHKNSAENFFKDTGIKFKIVARHGKDGLSEDAKETSQETRKKRGQMKDEVMQLVDNLHSIQKKTFPTIIQEFKILEVEGKVHNIGIGNLNEKSLSTKLLRWKNKRNEKFK